MPEEPNWKEFWDRDLKDGIQRLRDENERLKTEVTRLRLQLAELNHKQD